MTSYHGSVSSIPGRAVRVWIYGGQISTVTGFPPSTLVFPCQLSFQQCSMFFTRTTGLFSAAVPHPNNKKIN